MGTDIYLYAEKWDGQRWLLAEPAVPDQTSILSIPIPPEEWVWIPNTFSFNRNYTFFAILADVRNYDDITPISLPRGLPADITPEGKAIAEQTIEYSHSFSWLLLQEILAYDWSHNISNGSLTEAYIHDALSQLQQYGTDQPIRFIFWFN